MQLPGALINRRRFYRGVLVRNSVGKCPGLCNAGLYTLIARGCWYFVRAQKGLASEKTVLGRRTTMLWH